MKKKYYVLAIMMIMFIFPIYVFAKETVTVNKLSHRIVTPSNAYEEAGKVIMNYFGAKVEYEYEIVNNLNEEIELSEILATGLEKDYIKYSVDGFEVGDKITPKGKVNLKIITEVVEDGYDTIESIEDQEVNFKFSFQETKKETDDPINTTNGTNTNDPVNPSNGTINKEGSGEEDINGTVITPQKDNNNKGGNISQSNTLDNIGIYVFLITVAVAGAVVCFIYLSKNNVLNMKTITIGSLIVVCSITGAVIVSTFASSETVIEANVPVLVNYKNSYFLRPGVNKSFINVYSKIEGMSNIYEYSDDELWKEINESFIALNESKRNFYGMELPEEVRASQIVFHIVPTEQLEQIKAEIIEDPNVGVDLSAAHDYSILAFSNSDSYISDKDVDCSDYYYINETECENYYFAEFHIVSDKKIYFNENSSGLFGQIIPTEFTYNIAGLENVDTKYVKNMELLFAGFANKVKTVPTQIQSYGIVELDLANFDTRRVEDMAGMFMGANINSLNLGYGNTLWNTSNVKNMDAMFYLFPYKVKNVEKLNTSNCESMIAMFNQYGYKEAILSNTINLDLRGYDVSKVTNMADMFHNFGNHAKSSIEVLDAFGIPPVTPSSLDPNYINDKYYVNDITIDVSNWDARNVLTFENMFYNVGRGGNYLELKLSDRSIPGKETFFRTEKATDYSYMFQNKRMNSYASRYKLDLEGFNLKNVDKVRLSYMFDANNISKIFVGENWDISKTHEITRLSDDPLYGTIYIFGTGNMWLDGNKGTSCHIAPGLSYAHIDEGESNPGCLSDYRNELDYSVK